MSKASKALFPLLAHCAYDDSVMQYLGAVKPDLQASLKLADLTILIKTGVVSICQYKKKFKCGLFRVRMAAVKRRALAIMPTALRIQHETGRMPGGQLTVFSTLRTHIRIQFAECPDFGNVCNALALARMLDYLRSGLNGFTSADQVHDAAASFQPLFQRSPGSKHKNILVNGRPWVIELDGHGDPETHLCMETTIETMQKANTEFDALMASSAVLRARMDSLIGCVPEIPVLRKSSMGAVSNTTHDLGTAWDKLVGQLDES